METTATVIAVGVPKRRLAFAYDGGSRRIRKQVYAWDAGTSTWTLNNERRFIYDQWNLVAEVDQTGNLLKSHVWGLDLSQTMQGAGGVGGLLWSTIHSDSQPSTTNYQLYDGSGNVIALTDASTAIVITRYDYNAFGETVLVEGGDIAHSNPFRFSTKYEDDETGLYDYGFRYYDPVNGRWMNRDPIGDEAFWLRFTKGLNKKEIDEYSDERFSVPYHFVKNNTISNIDRFGLDVTVIIGTIAEGSTNVGGHVAISVTGYGTYSWGTEHEDRISLNDYLIDQTRLRENCLYWIPTTPEEDERAVNAFKQERAKGYSLRAGRTCATATSAALVEIGVFKNTTCFPRMLMNWFGAGLSRKPGVKSACFCKNVKGLPVADFATL